MINHYVISVMRKGATKETVCSCTENNWLSICQIFESTDDVANYKVGRIGKDFQLEDMYIKPSEGMRNAWPKWIPVEANDVSNG